MKFIVVSIAIFLLSISVQAQTPDCSKFKTGKFGYPKLPGKISLRKDSIQESYNNGKLEMIWKVKWLTECEYELTCTKLFRDDNLYKIGDRIVATIVSTDENCFTANCIFYNEKNPKGLSLPSTMCIVKD